MTIPIYSKDNIPTGSWAEYRKIKSTEAMSVSGPFSIKTREGLLHLPDNWEGYIAIDAHGYPYPIAKDEFEAIYERIDA